MTKKRRNYIIMRNQQIRLTEEDLHMLVEDAVKSYLINEGIEEGFWGGVKNAWNGMKGGNFNVKTNYRVGNWASSFNNYAQQAQNAIAQMQQIAQQSNNKPISTALGQIVKQMQKAAQNFTKMAQNVARPQNIDTTVKNPWAKKTASTPRSAVAGATGAGAAGASAGGTGTATTRTRGRRVAGA